MWVYKLEVTKLTSLGNVTECYIVTDDVNHVRDYLKDYVNKSEYTINLHKAFVKPHRWEEIKPITTLIYKL